MVELVLELELAASWGGLYLFKAPLSLMRLPPAVGCKPPCCSQLTPTGMQPLLDPPSIAPNPHSPMAAVDIWELKKVLHLFY